MSGHKAELIYRRYAIVGEAMLHENSEKLAAAHFSDKAVEREIVPLNSRKHEGSKGP